MSNHESGWFSKQVADSYVTKIHDTSPSENQVNKLYYHDPIFLGLLPDLNNKRVLDAGCGDFYLGELLRMSYPESNIYGIDTPDMASAFGKTKEGLVGGDVQNLPFANESMDVIYSSLVLHWIEDHEKMLQECQRVLKNNGKMVASLANPKGFKAGVHSTNDNGATYQFNRHANIDITKPRTDKVMLSSTIGPVNYYARPVEEYLQTMTDAGFKNIDIHEPTNETNPYQRQFITLRKWQQVPLFLFITAEK